MMFNSTIVRNGRLDDCWMQWKLPSRSSPLAPRCPIDIHQPTPQTQRDHPGCVRRWNVSEPSVFLSFFFFGGGWVFASFFFVRTVCAMQEMVLSGMSHLGDAVEADGHSISGIHRTHYMDPWPWVFYFFVFLFIFRLVGFSWRFDVVVFPMSFPYYRFEHIHWTFRRSSPGTLGRDSLPASAWNGEEALSIPVSGCEKLCE